MAQHAPQLARAELLPAAPPPVLLSHPTYAAAIAILVLDIKSTILTRNFFRPRLQNTNLVLVMLRLETLNSPDSIIMYFLEFTQGKKDLSSWVKIVSIALQHLRLATSL